ncbi:MAG: AI-2E family transporter, partial [Pseudomonadota bacterium]|nr:AI-2E family transporter [Pseudomonadota bacterium]
MSSTEISAPASPGATNRTHQIAVGALAGALVALGLWTLKEFLPALAWAAIFAIGLWPLYRRVQRRWPPGKHNVLVPALFTTVIGLVFFVPLALVAVQIGREAHSVVQWFQEMQRNGLPVPGLVDRLPFGRPTVTNWWQENLSKPAGGTALVHRLNRGDMVSIGRNVGSQVAHRLVLFFFTLLGLFFLFRDGEHLTSRMLVASRRAFGPAGERIAVQMVNSVHGTVDGLVLVGIGEGVVMGIAYVIAGVPHPTLFGALTAVAAMFPFGAPLAFGIACLLLLAKGATVAAIVVFVFGMIVSFAADHFVRPVLIGGATHLPFFWVLLGILGGIETWGLLGLFLGPAIMAALILLWREWTDG